jgi:hypothetical protein
MRTALSIVAMLALVAGAGTAFGEAISSHSPFSFSVFDSCNNEDVQVSGIFHGVSSAKENKDGSTTYSFMLNAKGIGVGAVSGTLYEFNDNIQSRFTVLGPDASGLQTRKLRLISRGGGQNLIVDSTYAIDEFGHVTVVSLDNCRGAGE